MPPPDVYRSRTYLFFFSLQFLPLWRPFRASGGSARAASGAEAAILLGGKMATQPSGGNVVAGSSAAPPKKSSFWSCFSCRMLAGSGLVAAGLWVHMGARQSLRSKRPGNLYDIFRMVFAIGKVGGRGIFPSGGEGCRFGRARLDTCIAFALQSGGHSLPPPPAPRALGSFSEGCNDAAGPPEGSISSPNPEQECIKRMGCFFF